MTTRTVDADAVLFDSDGVLVDSHDQVVASWSAMTAEFDLDFELIRDELHGVPSDQTLSRFLDGDRLAAAIVRVHELELATAAETTALPGAAALVESLPERRFAFVTSASRQLASARWSAAGIVVPPDVVTADDVARGKPHPEPFLTGAALLGVNPSRCVVFEDSAAGGAAALAAGATVIAVGSTPWASEGLARVPDLRAVTAGPGRSGFALSLTMA